VITGFDKDQGTLL